MKKQKIFDLDLVTVVLSEDGLTYTVWKKPLEGETETEYIAEYPTRKGALETLKTALHATTIDLENIQPYYNYTCYDVDYKHNCMLEIAENKYIPSINDFNENYVDICNGLANHATRAAIRSLKADDNALSVNTVVKYIKRTLQRTAPNMAETDVDKLIDRRNARGVRECLVTGDSAKVRVLSASPQKIGYILYTALLVCQDMAEWQTGTK